VVQRVSRAAVRVDDEVTGQIGKGLLVLLGVKQDDTPAAAQYTAEKIAGLRIFPDEQGRMDRSVLEAGGEVLVVSQFTLFGDARKGRRPSYTQAASGGLAVELYEEVCTALRALGLKVETGRFGAHMEVEMVGDGPVTILLDSERTF
jgi:D-tyrosyl-tRNA(Tyr) deacylase